ncbi:VCBS repeat-containing protein [Streptomyces sp. NBC_01077]|uniref:FG-GAP repeat domain-containing protein n=1 Tax=Streptomyces sp. NBC_01077 TaxID=2903746 RepID=UPI003866DA23|nr:VCBS repeat-containing protein [Streptomyces sp. NBC_01077]
MKHVRIPGRRLAAAAVTVVLAATGGTLTALPATAATAPAATQEDPQQTTARFPLNADVVGAGPSGFLSKTRGNAPEFRWTRYADGSSTVLPGAYAVGGGSDLVVTGDKPIAYTSRRLTVHDLSTPATAAAAPVEVDLDALGGYHLTGMAGSTLLLTREEGDHWKQYAGTIDAGTLKVRWVLGGPGLDCYGGEEGWTDTGSALYDCWIGEPSTHSKVAVDLGSGNSPMYLQDQNEYAQQGAVSATHVAWREMRLSGDGIVAHRRGSSVERWFPTDDIADPLHLVGGWMATGQKAHIDASTYADGAANPTKRPFTVQSIETGEKAVLLTAFSSAVAGPGGILLVRGGTPEQGEGLYRISPRADGGEPDIELVASTGQSTLVTLTDSATPTTLTGDQVARGVDFSWDLSRADSRVWLTLTHVRSRKTVYEGWPVPNGVAAGTPRRITWHWDGKDLEGKDWGSPAANGAYEWKLTARPDEGIGPDLVSTGRFTVTRPAAPHDYNDDGTADLLVRDTAGVLWRFGTRPTAPGGSLTDTGASRVGGGWGSYDRLVSVGNVAGGSEPDSVARDRSGALWLYRGTGDRNAPLTARTLIGGGWQTYDQLAGGSDLTGDGRADLVATDKAGDLYLYKGTGSATAPFATRKKIGFGWGVYNQLTATGNLAGGPAGDLVARDKAGVLWLYLGKGDGTFAARTKVGAGWGGFSGLTAVGDANGDGRADLVASNGDEVFYAGTGDWRAPFKPGARVSLTQDSPYNTAF